MAAPSLLQAVPVGWMLSSLPPGQPLLAQVARAAPCHAGQGWEWDGVRFDILHPAMESYANPRIRDNDRSCVLRIATAGASVLLTGDIELRSEAELLARSPGEFRSTLLVAPHHGGKSSSGPAFVEAVAPRVAVFTAGYRNAFGHPRPEVVARYREAGAALYRSDRHGAVIVRMDGAPEVSLGGFRQLRPRYWQERSGPPAEDFTYPAVRDSAPAATPVPGS